MSPSKDSYLGKRHWRVRAVLLAASCAGLASASLIAAGVGTATASAKQKTAPLVVWVDSTRVAAVKAYEKAHPSVKLDVVTVDGDANGDGTYQSKFALFNRVGHGWPDIYFSEENNDASSLADPTYKDAAALGSVVSQKVIKGFGSSMSNCTIGGKIVCLRNDLAQDVLWYNAPLMKQFGYTVPTTWQQWQTIGLDVAKNHPGYIVGTAGNSWDDDVYFWGNECPLNRVVKAPTVEIDPKSSNCTAIASLVDPLITDGTDPVQSVFGSTFAKTYGGTSSKILMMVGPSWYGADLFPGLGIPAGQIAAAAPLKTTSGASATGAVGGGLWFVSSHSKQEQLAASVVQWLATSPIVQDNTKISGTYPAYAPDDAAWVKASSQSKYFADNIGPAFAAAAKEVWTGWSAVPWSTDGIWASSVTPNLTSGASLSSQLTGYASALTNYAQSDGYTVKAG
jgi:ABC-type glycerol-3-phosphate transport system substrate-binding protein